MTIKRTISGMIGAGSLAHNRRDFIAENVDPDRVHLNIRYQNENLKEVYIELFDDSVERYVRLAYCVSYETIQNSLPEFKKLAAEYGLGK